MLAAGAASHRRSAVPLTGSAASKKAELAPTRRLLVEVSSIASSLALADGVQPNRSRASAEAIRTFSSSFRNVASPDAIAVLTSRTSSVALAGCQARMSIEPERPAAA